MKKVATALFAVTILATTIKLLTSKPCKVKNRLEIFLKEYQLTSESPLANGTSQTFNGTLSILSKKKILEIPIFFVKNFSKDKTIVNIYSGLGSAIGEPEQRNISNLQTIKILNKKKLNPTDIQYELNKLIQRL